MPLLQAGLNAKVNFDVVIGPVKVGLSRLMTLAIGSDLVVNTATGMPGLVYGSVTYTQRTRATEIGNLEFAVSKKNINVPIWAGSAAIVVGGVLVFVREKRH